MINRPMDQSSIINRLRCAIATDLFFEDRLDELRDAPDPLPFLNELIEAYRAELARVRALLDGDDLVLLCDDCVCADCGGPFGQHAPDGDCSCGCEPACDRFIRDSKLDQIAEAVQAMTGSPLSEAVAHAAWHALHPQ